MSKTGNGLKVTDRHAWKGKKSTLGLQHSTDIAPLFAATLPLKLPARREAGDIPAVVPARHLSQNKWQMLKQEQQATFDSLLPSKFPNELLKLWPN